MLQCPWIGNRVSSRVMNKLRLRVALATLALLTLTIACGSDDDDGGGSSGGDNNSCPSENPGNATLCQGYTPGLACTYDGTTCTCSGISWNCVGGSTSNNNTSSTNTTGGDNNTGFGNTGDGSGGRRGR